MVDLMSSNWTAAQRSEVDRRLSEGETHAQIARDLGIRRESVRHYGKTLSEAVQSPANSNQKPRYKVPYIRGDEVAAKPANDDIWHPLGEPEPVRRVLVIGDAHDKPGRCKERFRWIGKHIAQGNYDAVVVIGDVASIDSLSGHEKPGSRGDAERPAFYEDLESFEQALSILHSELPVRSVPIHLTWGNHEERTWTVANLQPKQCGDLPIRLEQIPARYGWRTYRYGTFLNLFGIDFVHTPLNRMNKPSNGDLAERIHANKSVRDLVVGHTHYYNVVTVLKNRARTRVVNVGTAMPWGVVETYNSPGSPPQDYGIVELRILNGQIIGNKFIDMLELEAMYS